jgi:chemotaxis regulatin CheY-phosphate phosphatase CheZ
MTGIKRKKKNSQMDGSPGVDRERGETGSTMIDNMNALVNQDFKDFEGRPIKRKLD